MSLHKIELKLSMDTSIYWLVGFPMRLFILVMNEKIVFTGHVRHSLSVSASHLKPWVAAEKCGIIICSHLTCTWRSLFTHRCRAIYSRITLNVYSTQEEVVLL